jgi:hypothetical protein
MRAADGRLGSSLRSRLFDRPQQKPGVRRLPTSPKRNTAQTMEAARQRQNPRKDAGGGQCRVPLIGRAFTIAGEIAAPPISAAMGPLPLKRTQKGTNSTPEGVCTRMALLTLAQLPLDTRSVQRVR